MKKKKGKAVSPSWAEARRIGESTAKALGGTKDDVDEVFELLGRYWNKGRWSSREFGLACGAAVVARHTAITMEDVFVVADRRDFSVRRFKEMFKMVLGHYGVEPRYDFDRFVESYVSSFVANAKAEGLLDEWGVDGDLVADITKALVQKMCRGRWVRRYVVGAFTLAVVAAGGTNATLAQIVSVTRTTGVTIRAFFKSLQGIGIDVPVKRGSVWDARLRAAKAFVWFDGDGNWSVHVPEGL